MTHNLCILGSYGDRLTGITCDATAILALRNTVLSMWDEQAKIFNSIFSKIAKHKYFIDEDTVVMKYLSSPFNSRDVFYGLQKEFMPYPPLLVLIPPLRYLQFFDSFFQIICPLFRKLKLVWAANNINNLILTINPNYQSEDESVVQFDALINESTLSQFVEYKLSTATLFRSGAFNGNYNSTDCHKNNIFQTLWPVLYRTCMLLEQQLCVEQWQGIETWMATF